MEERRIEKMIMGNCMRLSTGTEMVTYIKDVNENRKETNNM